MVPEEDSISSFKILKKYKKLDSVFKMTHFLTREKFLCNGSSAKCGENEPIVHFQNARKRGSTSTFGRLTTVRFWRETGRSGHTRRAV
jgi:hypothetical protein